jgi:hypothetical protein
MTEIEITNVTGLIINAVSESDDAVRELTAKCEFTVSDEGTGLYISGNVTKLWENSYPVIGSPLSETQMHEDMIGICRSAAYQFIQSKFGGE